MQTLRWPAYNLSNSILYRMAELEHKESEKVSYEKVSRVLKVLAVDIYCQRCPMDEGSTMGVRYRHSRGLKAFKEHCDSAHSKQVPWGGFCHEDGVPIEGNALSFEKAFALGDEVLARM